MCRSRCLAIGTRRCFHWKRTPFWLSLMLRCAGFGCFWWARDSDSGQRCQRSSCPCGTEAQRRVEWATEWAAERETGGLVGFCWTICLPPKVLPGAHWQVAWRASTISATGSSSTGCWRPAQPDRSRWAGLLATELSEGQEACGSWGGQPARIDGCVQQWCFAKRVVTCRLCQGHHSLEAGRSWKTPLART